MNRSASSGVGSCCFPTFAFFRLFRFAQLSACFTWVADESIPKRLSFVGICSKSIPNICIDSQIAESIPAHLRKGCSYQCTYLEPPRAALAPDAPQMSSRCLRDACLRYLSPMLLPGTSPRCFSQVLHQDASPRCFSQMLRPDACPSCCYHGPPRGFSQIHLPDVFPRLFRQIPPK